MGHSEGTRESYSEVDMVCRSSYPIAFAIEASGHGCQIGVKGGPDLMA